ALEFALRYDVGTGAEVGEGLDHRLVGIRLHRVADERAHVGEGIDEHLVMPRQRRGRIAIERGGDGPREINEIDRLGVKDAVAVGEMVHSASAQLSSQSMGVLRFGACGAAMTLPSGPIAGSRSGRETLVSTAVAAGGGSSPPLRPQPAS